MDTNATATAGLQATTGAAAEPKRGRRSRQQTEEVVRYFLPKEGSSAEKPELGVELPSEGEALIQAFRSKNSIFYTLLAYQAEAERQGGSPTLVKRPLRK